MYGITIYTILNEDGYCVQYNVEDLPLLTKEDLEYQRKKWVGACRLIRHYRRATHIQYHGNRAYSYSKPIECKTCEIRFATKKNLRRHIDKFHRN